MVALQNADPIVMAKKPVKAEQFGDDSVCALLAECLHYMAFRVT